MRRSHLCLECGGDLCRERAKPDPHYGLPMVVCPQCGTAAVRRRHPVERRLRSVRRVGTSLSTVALQLSLLVLLTVLVVLTCSEMRADLDLAAVVAGDPDALVAVLFGCVALPVGIGIWLTAGFGHWPRGTPWLVFPLFPLVFLTFGTVGRRIVGIDESAAAWSRWRAETGVLITMMIIALAGIPIGRLCRTAHASAIRWLWRTRRRRMRQRSLQ